MTETSTPLKAREHARSQAGKVVESMPTIPASAAKDLPPNVSPQNVLWDETIAGGGYASHILPRGSRLRLTNIKGDACANVLIYNADCPTERLNVADTVKVQWNAYLGKGKLILSDMGRALMSILDDTAGNHDTFCGASNAKTNARKYGAGDNYGPQPNARDRFLLALAKHGLGRKDVMPNINLFKNVRIEKDGSCTFVENSSKAGDFVELRAEMNVLVVIANTPHVLDPRKTYTCTPLRLTAWRGEITPSDDPIRNATPENQRAFENVEEYFRS
ncbi:MAG TPA: urea amidolyase associated protein UAAP1 [Tepidisphaeraceae bacterium]|nr:urea amidolyase associated protein UAAP1 [Tepidisphaeraceae bacterium]